MATSWFCTPSAASSSTRFRKLKPKTLIITGVVFNLLLIGLLVGFRFGGVPYMRSTAARAEAIAQAGETPTWWQGKVREGWEEMSKSRDAQTGRFPESHRPISR